MGNMKIKIEISYEGNIFSGKKYLSQEHISYSKMDLKSLISYYLSNIEDDIIKQILDKLEKNHG